jgi:hypothetical protein
VWDFTETTGVTTRVLWGKFANLRASPPLALFAGALDGGHDLLFRRM